jgi:hypothetical protein
MSVTMEAGHGFWGKPSSGAGAKFSFYANRVVNLLKSGSKDNQAPDEADTIPRAG